VTEFSIDPITRLISAPPHEVFRAFVDPERLVLWFAPDGCRCVEADIDPRPCGGHRTVVETPDGTRHRTEGEFIEFVPDRRLVMTWRYVGPAGPSGGESVVTVDLEPVPPGSTMITLQHDALASARDAAGVHEGWRQMVHGIDPALGSPS
jgi:uncharacterized protein YndB with AHSA1/START domain